MKVTAIAGGVGASKFLAGLCRAMPPEDVTVIVNTGDDIEMFGLYIAPDLDIVTYTLAEIVNPATGWGIAEDTFHCLDRLLAYTGSERWFNLGDRDLAAHIFRTAGMRAGRRLSEMADELRQRLGVATRILPMTDAHVPTTIVTDEGELHFQEYLVRRRAQPRVREIRFENIASAAPAPGVREAILEADAIFVCPSNPLISIGPVLAVPGLRDLLQQTRADIAAISPVVGGASLKGPTDKMLAELGFDVSAAQVARMYADFLDLYVLDERDAGARAAIEAMGLRVLVTDTVMTGLDEKLALARATLASVRARGEEAHPG